MKRIMALLLILCAFSVSGCSPVKGYPGPELPLTEISQVFPDQDGSTYVYQSGLDGMAFSSTGIHVLPGKHVFDMQVGTPEPPHSCHIITDMDFYGYDQCFKKKDSRYCDCFDYLTIKKECYYEVRDGRCNGTFPSKKGKIYKVRVTKKGKGNAESAVYEEYGPRVGTGKCDMQGWRTASSEDYLGTGRYTANSNGVYNCY